MSHTTRCSRRSMSRWVRSPDVLEGVQQDHRRHLLVRRELRQLPGQQVRVEGKRLQVRLSFQQVGETRCSRRSMSRWVRSPDVLEGVQQDHRRHLLVRRELRQLPGQQVRVEGKRLQVRLSFQQVGEPRASGERPDGLPALAQRPHEETGHRTDRRADAAR
ncbi:hypothetical protein ACWD0A_31945 [Streptomyces sp. NPDC002867]